jgi:hypothetical protein
MAALTILGVKVQMLGDTHVYCVDSLFFSLLAINNSSIKAAALGPMGFGNVYILLLRNKIRLYR